MNLMTIEHLKDNQVPPHVIGFPYSLLFPVVELHRVCLQEVLECLTVNGLGLITVKTIKKVFLFSWGGTEKSAAFLS